MICGVGMGCLDAELLNLHAAPAIRAAEAEDVSARTGLTCAVIAALALPADGPRGPVLAMDPSTGSGPWPTRDPGACAAWFDVSPTLQAAAAVCPAAGKDKGA